MENPRVVMDRNARPDPLRLLRPLLRQPQRRRLLQALRHEHDP
jgi:hypothetical protein